MTYVDKLFQKANIQGLGKFLLCETQEEAYSSDSYEQRINNAYQKCIRTVEQYDTEGENSDLFSAIFQVISEFENIYTEIGLQAGFLLKKDFLTHKESTQCQKSKISISPDMLKRMNLQSLSYFIKEGSRTLQIDETSFTEREQQAEVKLEQTLSHLLDEKQQNILAIAISEYTAKKEEIQFSIGMKVGARLALLLMDDSDFDF